MTPLRDGWSDDELGRLVRSCDLSRLRRGAYVAGTLPPDAAANHALLVRATLAGLRRPAVVSHQSAAVLTGCRCGTYRWTGCTSPAAPERGNDSGRLLCCHVARLRDDEIVEVDGEVVTDPVRTALDLARSLPHEAAVVTLDAALRLGLVAHDALRTRLLDVAGTPGSRSAARAVQAADGRSGSVGESRSRVVLDRWKLPPSALQFEVRSRDGRLIGRTDFAWEEHRLVGEFDGRVEYGRFLRPGEDAGDAVLREELREDSIRDEGWGVVRWTWSDLRQPHLVAARVRRRLR